MKRKCKKLNFELEVFLSDTKEKNPRFSLKVSSKYFDKPERTLSRKFVHEIIGAVGLNVTKAASLSVREVEHKEIYTLEGNGTTLGGITRVRKDG